MVTATIIGSGDVGKYTLEGILELQKEIKHGEFGAVPKDRWIEQIYVYNRGKAKNDQLDKLSEPWKNDAGVKVNFVSQERLSEGLDNENFDTIIGESQVIFLGIGQDFWMPRPREELEEKIRKLEGKRNLSQEETSMLERCKDEIKATDLRNRLTQLHEEGKIDPVDYRVLEKLPPNIALVREYARRLRNADYKGHVVLVTNPPDALVYAFLSEFTKGKTGQALIDAIGQVSGFNHIDLYRLNNNILPNLLLFNEIRFPGRYQVELKGHHGAGLCPDYERARVKWENGVTYVDEAKDRLELKKAREVKTFNPEKQRFETIPDKTIEEVATYEVRKWASMMKVGREKEMELLSRMHVEIAKRLGLDESAVEHVSREFVKALYQKSDNPEIQQIVDGIVPQFKDLKHIRPEIASPMKEVMAAILIPDCVKDDFKKYVFMATLGRLRDFFNHPDIETRWDQVRRGEYRELYQSDEGLSTGAMVVYDTDRGFYRARIARDYSSEDLASQFIKASWTPMNNIIQAMIDTGNCSRILLPEGIDIKENRVEGKEGSTNPPPPPLNKKLPAHIKVDLFAPVVSCDGKIGYFDVRKGKLVGCFESEEGYVLNAMSLRGNQLVALLENENESRKKVQVFNISRPGKPEIDIDFGEYEATSLPHAIHICGDYAVFSLPYAQSLLRSFDLSNQRHLHDHIVPEELQEKRVTCIRAYEKRENSSDFCVYAAIEDRLVPFAICFSKSRSRIVGKNKQGACTKVNYPIDNFELLFSNNDFAGLIYSNRSQGVVSAKKRFKKEIEPIESVNGVFASHYQDGKFYLSVVSQENEGYRISVREYGSCRSFSEGQEPRRVTPIKGIIREQIKHMQSSPQALVAITDSQVYIINLGNRSIETEYGPQDAGLGRSVVRL